MMAEKVFTQAPASAGSWRAGVRAATGLAAALGPWQSPLAERWPAGRPGPSASACKPVDLTDAAAGSADRGPTPGDESSLSLARAASARQAILNSSPAEVPHFAAGPSAAVDVQLPDAIMPDVAPGFEDRWQRGGSSQEKGKQAAVENAAAGAEDVVSPGRPAREQLAQLRAQAQSRWQAQQERERVAHGTGPSRLATHTGGSAGTSAGGRLEQRRHDGVGQHDGGEEPSAMDLTDHVDVAGDAEDERRDVGDKNVCIICYSAIEFAMVSCKMKRACLALSYGQASRMVEVH